MNWPWQVRPSWWWKTIEYINAVRDYPFGIFCHFCWRLNLFFDDCGFFYIHPDDHDHGVCCEHCYRGWRGEMHIKRYGVGDR